MCMTSSDHRHPGAKKRPANNSRDCRKFPLIVGPPFIHATNPATSTRDLRQSDCSTRGRDLLETRQPEANPLIFLAHGKLQARFELVQPGGLITAKRLRDASIGDPAKDPGAEVLQP